MLYWMSGYTRKISIKNEFVREKVGVTTIVEKLVKKHLRWFDHIQRSSLEAPVV